MLDSCYNCIRKHLGTAHAYFQKALAGDGFYFFWFGIGQMILAEEESRREEPVISKKILIERIKMLERFEFYPQELIDASTQLGAAHGYMLEAKSNRYPTHFWYGIGRMTVCENLDRDKFLDIVESIEAERLNMIDNESYWTDFSILIDDIWVFIKNYDILNDPDYWTNFDDILAEVADNLPSIPQDKEEIEENTNKENDSE